MHQVLQYLRDLLNLCLRFMYYISYAISWSTAVYAEIFTEKKMQDVNHNYNCIYNSTLPQTYIYKLPYTIRSLTQR